MKTTNKRWQPRLRACAMACAMAPGWLAPALAQQGRPAVEVAGPAPVASAATRVHRYTLRELGALYPMQLRGIDGVNSVPFAVRADEVVVGAKLKLDYSYSPAMLEKLSHLKVLVNDQVAATLPVPNADGGHGLQREVAIAPQLITEFNRVGVQLIGHYTMECEDPLHSSLWANVSNGSVLELTTAPVALPNDLALLPLPFFDRRDVAPLKLPFVFVGAAGNEVLEAAGTLASWFGGLAGYRGARFEALRDIPVSGNAVVFLTGRDHLDGVAAASGGGGPTVSVQTHPRDPYGKLLVISGRDANELKLAAQALAVGGASLAGSSATITSFAKTAPRKPYDAPRWLRGDRPVRFGELVEPQDLEVSGYNPDLIRVNLRLPPDLYPWRGKGVAVDLRYRYTPRLASSKATLNVNVNQQFLTAFPLTAVGYQGDSAIERLVNRVVPPRGQPFDANFELPLFKLPSQSQLQFHYYYEPLKQGACRDAPLDNVKGAIDGDSTVDISGLPHFIAMPDLAAFSNSGFPFTRMADLSETAVVLPAGANTGDWSAYLDLMGRMGDATGYPATAVTVATPEQVRTQAVSDKDLLVLASGNNQPLLTDWAERMPASLGDERRFQLSDLAYRLIGWWDSDSRVNAQSARAAIGYRGTATDAYLTGFESPLAGGRSVVVVAGNAPQGLRGAVDAILDPDRVKRIQGSLAVVSGGEVSSLVSDQSYYVGSLGPLRYVQWFLSQRPWLMLLGGAFSALLLALAWYLVLRARAKNRLEKQ